MRELTARKKAATAAGDTALVSETNTKIQSVEGLIRKLQTAKKTVDTQIKSDLETQIEAKAAAAREEAAKKVQEQGGYEFDLIEPEVKPTTTEAPKPKPPKAAAPTEDTDAEALIKRIAEMQAAKAPEVKAEEPTHIDVDGTKRPVHDSTGQRIHPTDEGIKNFWKGFEGTKAVDEQGRPIKLFHGTNKDFPSFEYKKIRSGHFLGKGFYFGHKGKAEEYSGYGDPNEEYSGYGDPNPELSDNVHLMPVYLNIKKPFIWHQGFTDADITKLRQEMPEFGTAYKAWLDYVGEDYAKDRKPSVEELGVINGDREEFIQKALKKADYDGIMASEISGEELGDRPWEDTSAEFVVFDSTQIKSATGNVGKFDTTKRDLIAAKGEPAENAHTPDTLRVALSEKYGKNTPKLEVSTREAEGVEPDVKGFYDPKTKRVVLIADNIGKGEDIHGLLRHEVAVHAKRLGKTDPEFQKILDHLQALKEQGNQQVIDAYNRVPKDTKTEKVHEEALAYLSQHAPNLPIVKRFMSWMRRTAYKITGRTDWLKAEDFGPMADAILKRGEKVQTHGATAERMYARRTTEDQERIDKLIKKAPSSSEEFATNAKDAAKGVFKVITDSETRSDLATKTRQQLTAQSAPIAKALQKLETFGESTGIRADLLRNQMDGVGHLFANALRMGAPDISEGGMMKIKADPKLALHKWFTDSDKLDVDQDNAMAVLRVLMGEQWAKESGAGREKVAQYRDYAATLKAAAKTATGKDKTKYTKLADGLIEEAKALEERHGEAPMEGLEKLVSPEDIKWAHDLLRRSPKLQEWVDRTHAINREAVDFLVKSGVLDKATAADWKSRPYIPLFKSLQDLKDQQDENLRMFGGSAKSLTTRKAIKGGTHQVNVPENMLRSWMQMYTSGYKNHVRATAVKQMRLLGEVERTHKNDPLAVLVKRDGKNEYWKVPDKGIAQSLEMGPLSHWVFNDLTSGLVNTLRFGAIKNPVYWVRSITREPLTANFTSRTGFVNPATTLLHTLKALVGISPESKELFKYGTTGYAESQLEPENFSRAITKTPGYKKILDTWNHIHSSFDAATRVSVFNQAKKEGAKLGLTGEKLNDFAAMKASEFANFSTKGANQVAREMGRMTPFFNASLNSLDNLARNATGMHLNAREKAQAKQLFWSRAVGTAYMTGLYTLAMLNDPKYRNASDSEWTMNYFMPSDKEDRWTPVAAGFEPAFLFKFIPELLIRTYTGNLTPEQATGIGAEVAQSKMLPPMMPMLPALMAQLTFGYDVNLGREVESIGSKRLPAEYRDKGASEIAKKLVQDYDLGKLGVSPVKMDALGRGVMGELYNMSAMMADLYLASKEGISLYDKDVTQKYPVAKAIYTNPKNVEKAPVFYEAAETAEQMVSVATRKASRGFAEQYNKIWTDPESKELLRIAPQLRQFRENIQRLDKSMETLENTKMPEAERQLRYNDMLRVRNGFIQQGAEVYEESKRKLKKEAAGR